MWKAVYLAIFLTFALMVNIAHAESTVKTDGVVARNVWMVGLKKLFDQGQYAELEKIAQKIRRNKEHFPEGAEKISYFYDAFDKPITKDDETWLNLLANIETWRKTFPESITPQVAEARVWDNYAWEARGGGYANEVSEQRWMLFRERLRKARDLAERAPLKSSDDCPARHALLLKAAYSDNLNDYEKKFRMAIAFDPSYSDFYQLKASFLLPQWHGSPGDSIRFANEAIFLAPKGQGLIIYSRIMWHLWAKSDEVSTFKEPGVSWEKVKQGFFDLEKQYPDSPWNLNWFCRLACAAGDKKTAQILFTRIGSRPYIEAWGVPNSAKARFESMKQWAFSGN
jgi:hypothetical protein